VGLCLQCASLWGCLASKSPDIHKILQSFRSQYQPTARYNICQTLPRSALRDSQRFLEACPHVRLIYYISGKHALHFCCISLVGSTTLSMTYSIDVRPYNDPYIKIAEEAMKAAAVLLIAGAFLVDVIPILKYVPAWFPGAKFQSKAAMLREHATRVRNAPFAATEKLMVCDLPPLLRFLLNYLMIHMYTF
jgi:hypothetical protein